MPRKKTTVASNVHTVRVYVVNLADIQRLTEALQQQVGTLAKVTQAQAIKYAVDAALEKMERNEQ